MNGMKRRSSKDSVLAAARSKLIASTFGYCGIQTPAAEDQNQRPPEFTFQPSMFFMVKKAG